MAVAYFLFAAAAALDVRVGSCTWRSETREGAKWAWAGFGLSDPPFFFPFLYTTTLLGFSVFCVPNLLDRSPWPPFSFVYVLYHHIYPNASHKFGEKKRISGSESYCSFVDTQPSTIKTDKMRSTASYWMVVEMI